MNNTVWKETAREAQLDLISDMFDDLRQDHLALVNAVEVAVIMLEKGETGLKTALNILEVELENRKPYE